MPKSVNKCIFIGYCGKDVEVKYLPNGTPVGKVSLAVNEQWKDKDGERKEKTEWINLVFWAKLAEIASEYVHKGSQIYVEGKMQTRSWEKDGQKHYMTEVSVHDLVLLGGKKDGDGGGQSYDRNGFDQSERQPARTGARPVTEEDPITSEDIPF